MERRVRYLDAQGRERERKRYVALLARIAKGYTLPVSERERNADLLARLIAECEEARSTATTTTYRKADELWGTIESIAKRRARDGT